MQELAQNVPKHVQDPSKEVQDPKKPLTEKEKEIDILLNQGLSFNSLLPVDVVGKLFVELALAIDSLQNMDFLHTNLNSSNVLLKNNPIPPNSKENPTKISDFAWNLCCDSKLKISNLGICTKLDEVNDLVTGNIYFTNSKFSVYSAPESLNYFFFKNPKISQKNSRKFSKKSKKIPKNSQKFPKKIQKFLKKISKYY